MLDIIIFYVIIIGGYYSSWFLNFEQYPISSIVIFICEMLLVTLIGNRLITKEKFYFRFTLTRKKILLLLIMLILIVLTVTNNYSLIIKNIAHSIFMTLNAVKAAIVEELVFRGVILVYLIKFFKNKENKKYTLKALLVSSLLFGLFHMIIDVYDAGISVAFMQSLFPIGLGFVLGAIYIRTASLIFPMIIHFLIDFSSLITVSSEVETSVKFSTLSLMMALLLVGIYIVIGLCIIPHVNDNNYLLNKKVNRKVEV